MGSYIQANLIRGEAVVYQAKPHWILFLSWRSLVTLGLLPLVEYVTSEFAVTNKRIIMKTGWISRQVLELNLHKIESVNVDQSLLGRLLGYGTITVIGTGGTRETFDRIAHPLAFRKAFQEQESEFEDTLDRQRATSSTPKATPSQ
ncbi:MAG TPA: PH domain-containing protein [Nitrospiraceae bacterium]|nr:PH domain-containing protein [Nitrospiraceae bacterium]